MSINKKIQHILKAADLPKNLSDELKKELESHFYEKELDLQFAGLKPKEVQERLNKDFGQAEVIGATFHWVHKKTLYALIKTLLKRINWWIVVLLILNVMWMIFAVYQYEQIQRRNIDIYSLEGTNGKWMVDNYSILLNKNWIQREGARLTYLGDPADIAKVASFEVTIYERNPENGIAPALGKTVGGPGGPVNMADNINNLGSIISPYEYDEAQKTVDDYENSYVQIKWTDLQGKTHGEHVELNIIDHTNAQDLLK